MANWDVPLHNFSMSVYELVNTFETVWASFLKMYG